MSNYKHDPTFGISSTYCPWVIRSPMISRRSVVAEWLGRPTLNQGSWVRTWENHHCEKHGNTQISPNLSHMLRKRYAWRSYQTKPGLPSGCQVNIKCLYAKSTCLGSNYRNISSLTLVQKVIPGYLQRTVDNYLWLISHDLSHGVPLMIPVKARRGICEQDTLKSTARGSQNKQNCLWYVPLTSVKKKEKQKIHPAPDLCHIGMLCTNGLSININGWYSSELVNMLLLHIHVHFH
jgi:hypothetical protein